MSPRTGRPKAEKPKATQLAVRLDDELLGKLDQVAEHHKETRVDSMRRGIETLYADLETKK